MRASGWKANSTGGQEKFPEEVTFGKYMHIRRGRGSKLWVEKAAGGKARGLPRQSRTNTQGVAERQDAGTRRGERQSQMGRAWEATENCVGFISTVKSLPLRVTFPSHWFLLFYVSPLGDLRREKRKGGRERVWREKGERKKDIPVPFCWPHLDMLLLVSCKELKM